MTTTEWVDFDQDFPDDMGRLEWKALPNAETSSPLTGVIGHDDSDGTVTAIVAISGTGDKVGDVIVPGSLGVAVKRLKPKGVLDHNWGATVSKLVYSKELMPGDPQLPRKTPNGDPWPVNAGGLLVKAQYNLDKELGRDAYSDAKFYGPDLCFSIGYKVRPGGARMRGGRRYLHDYDIYEWSHVLHGAHELATLTGVKSLSDGGDWYAEQRSGSSVEGTIEVKALPGRRIVRNAQFWGLPVGTPIRSGMKPHGRAHPATPEEIAATTAPDGAPGRDTPQPGQAVGKPGELPMPDMPTAAPAPGVTTALAALHARYQELGEIQAGSDPVAGARAAATRMAISGFAQSGADVHASPDGQLAALHTPSGWTILDTANGGSGLPTVPADIPPDQIDAALAHLASLDIPWSDIEARKKRWSNPKQKRTDQQAVRGILDQLTPFSAPTPVSPDGRPDSSAQRDAIETAIDSHDRAGLLDALMEAPLPEGEDPYELSARLMVLPTEQVTQKLDELFGPSGQPPAEQAGVPAAPKATEDRYAAQRAAAGVPDDHSDIAPIPGGKIGPPKTGTPPVDESVTVREGEPQAGYELPQTPSDDRKYGPSQFVNTYGVKSGDYPTVKAGEVRVGDHVMFSKHDGGKVTKVKPGRKGQVLISYDDGVTGAHGDSTRGVKEGTYLPLVSAGAPAAPEPATPVEEGYKPTGNLNAPHKLTDAQLEAEHAGAVDRFKAARAKNLPTNSLEHTDSRTAMRIFGDEKRKRAAAADQGDTATPEPTTPETPEAPPAETYDTYGVAEGPDGELTLDEKTAARQDRVEAILEAGSTALKTRSAMALGENRRDLVDELTLQNELARRDTERKKEAAAARQAKSGAAVEGTTGPDGEGGDGTDTVEDTTPKVRPGVAGAAEDLGDALNATPRDDDAVQVAADRFAKLLARQPADSKSFIPIHKALGDGDIHAAIESGALKAGMLFTAAGALREERRTARNEGAKKRRAAKRIERDRIRSLIGAVDAELRGRGVNPEDYGGHVEGVAKVAPGAGDGRSEAAAPARAPSESSASTPAPSTAPRKTGTEPPPGTRARANALGKAIEGAGGIMARESHRVEGGSDHGAFAKDAAASAAVIDAIHSIGWAGVTAEDTTRQTETRRYIEIYVPDPAPSKTATRDAENGRIADELRAKQQAQAARIIDESGRPSLQDAYLDARNDAIEAAHSGHRLKLRKALWEMGVTDPYDLRPLERRLLDNSDDADTILREVDTQRDSETNWRLNGRDESAGRTGGEVVPAVPPAGLPGDQGPGDVLRDTGGAGRAGDRTDRDRTDGPGPARGDVQPETGAPPASPAGRDRTGDAENAAGTATPRLAGLGLPDTGDTGPRHAPGDTGPGGPSADRRDGGVQRRDGGAGTAEPNTAGQRPGAAPETGEPDHPVTTAERDTATAAEGQPVPEGTAELPDEQPTPDRAQLDAIPDTGTDFHPVNGEDFAPAGKAAKLKANIAALHVLRQLQTEHRPATPDEQHTLARWAGWGGLPEVFDDKKPQFAAQREELRGLLDEKEWAEARRNTLNAHYTDATAVTAMWQAVQDLGLDGGRVLEPGSGSGTFIGFSPENVDMIGVELDSTTAAISRALYPSATIRNESFADTRLPAGSMDAVIGNVPFGDFALTDRVHNPGRKHSIHNHFILKSLAATKPGGVCALLTSRYTLDSHGEAARKQMADMGDLIGAVRLPTGSHQKTAETRVIEDILIFRRRGPAAEPLTSQDWIHSSKREVNGFTLDVNDYFTQHPEQVLGDLTAEKGQYGTGSLIVHGDTDLTDTLPAALGRVTDTAREHGIAASERLEAPAAITDASAQHEGYIGLNTDGEFIQVADGAEVPFSVPATQREELTALCGLRDTLSGLLGAESATVSDAGSVRELRAALNTQYDDYTARYGPINRYKLTANGARSTPSQGGFRRDPMSAIVRALEVYDPETGTGTKTDIFRKRSVAPRELPTTADNPTDALALCLDTFGEVRLPEIARMLGTDETDARTQLGDLVYEQPPLSAAEEDAAFTAHIEAAAHVGMDIEGRFGGSSDTAPLPNTATLDTIGESVRESGRLEPAAAYLSGNVRRKLAAAEAAATHDPRFQANADALKAVIPPDLGIDEVDGRLGAAWIPAADVQQFLVDLINDGEDRYGSIKVATSGGGIWTVTGGDWGKRATEQWGTSRYSAGQLVQAMLEQKPIRVDDYIEDENGNKKRFPNLDETTAAQAKAEELQERFSEWLWEDRERSQRLLSNYNNQFNAIRLRSYDDVPRVFPGMAEGWVPREHQVAAVNRIVSEPCALLGHVVGAGKAQPMDAPILTPSGFRRMGDLMVGNLVIAADGSSSPIIGVYPQGPLDNYQVTFTDGAVVECNDEHLWRVQSKDWEYKGVDPKVLTLAEIIERGLTDSKGGPRWKVPMAAPAEFDCGLPRPVDPYLLGVLIGDGSLANASTVRFTSADPEIIAAVEATVPVGYVVKHSEGVRPYDYRISPIARLTRGRNTLVRDLEDLELMGRTARSKHLPRAYREAPSTVRLAVLQGLMDTDGHQPPKPGHNPILSTVSPHLRDDVVWLVRSLGGTARVRSKLTASGSTSHDITINLPAQFTPFRLSRKASAYQPTTKYRPYRMIASVERVGRKPMQCIAIAHPSHLYVADGFTVTHNTAEMAMGAAELKRLGMASKPSIVVPNHMLEQFSREFLQIYPNAKILAAGTDDLKGDKRREFVARAATGDWDCVILTQEAMELIPVSKEAMGAYITRETAVMRTQLAQAKKDAVGNEAKEKTVKKMENAIIKAEEALKAKLDTVKDAGVTFEKTGIDYVFVDEAHQYSNLRTVSNIQGAGATGANKASDLHMKIEHLRANNASGRVATFATGTPIRNTVTQAYIMQRFMRPDMLEQAGIHSFDQWAATFGQTVDEMELKPEGAGFRQTTRFAKFRNVPELLRMFHVFADVKTAEDLNLPTPELETGGVQNMVVPASDELKAYITELGQRAEEVRAGSVAPEDDNMLKISTDGRKAALSMRLVEGEHQSGKIEAAADNIFGIYQKHKDRPVPCDINDPAGGDCPPPGGMQLVFCDMGTPSSDRWNAYDELRNQLVERGMDRGSIRFMHEAKNDREKAELFAAARNGQVSVLIGSTEKMGVGTNVQRRAVALHHLDAPWRPSDVEQRDGRIMRQGNTNATVGIYRYVTEGSFDAYMWQTLERKKKFIDQIMRGKLDQREIEDVGDTALSYAEVKALATGNPLLMQKTKADTLVGKLTRLERAHQRTQTNLRRDVESYTTNAKVADADAASFGAAIAKRTDTTGDRFALVTRGRKITDRGEAASELRTTIRDVITDSRYDRDPKPRYLATFGGHDLVGQVERYTDHNGYNKFSITLSWDGVPGTITTLKSGQIDDLASGTFITLGNSLVGFESRQKLQRNRAQSYRDEIKVMRDRIGVAFPHAEQLSAARDESARLQAAMEAAGHADGGTGEDAGPDGLAIARGRAATRAANLGRGGAGPEKERLKRFANPVASGKAYASPDGALAAMGAANNLTVFSPTDGEDVRPPGLTGVVDDPQALLDDLTALDIPWGEGMWQVRARHNAPHEPPDYAVPYEERERRREAASAKRQAAREAEAAQVRAVWERHLRPDDTRTLSGMAAAKQAAQGAIKNAARDNKQMLQRFLKGSDRIPTWSSPDGKIGAVIDTDGGVTIFATGNGMRINASDGPLDDPQAVVDELAALDIPLGDTEARHERWRDYDRQKTELATIKAVFARHQAGEEKSMPADAVIPAAELARAATLQHKADTAITGAPDDDEDETYEDAVARDDRYIMDASGCMLRALPCPDCGNITQYPVSEGPQARSCLMCGGTLQMQPTPATVG